MTGVRVSPERVERRDVWRTAATVQMAPPCQTSARAVSCAARASNAPRWKSATTMGSPSTTSATLAGMRDEQRETHPVRPRLRELVRRPCAASVESDGSAAVDSAITKMPCGKSQRRIAHEK